MDNKVGDKLFTSQKLTAIVKQVQGVRDAVRPYGIVLTPAQRKRVLRQRKGAETEMRRVHALATKYGVDVPNVPLDGMQNDLTLAGQMATLENELAPALTLVQDTGAQADSEGWEAFLAYYGVLASIASRVPELAAELAPTIAFMANGPRSSTAVSAASTTASTPPPLATATEAPAVAPQQGAENQAS